MAQPTRLRFPPRCSRPSIGGPWGRTVTRSGDSIRACPHPEGACLGRGTADTETTAVRTREKADDERCGISRKSARNLLALFTALVALASVAASPAASSATDRCSVVTISRCIRSCSFLDPLPYSLLPGARLRVGRAGLAASGRRTGRQRQRVRSSSPRPRIHTRCSCLRGARPRARPMCMGLVLPIVRFFSTGGVALSYLRVEAVYTDASGRQRSLDLLPPAACRRARGHRACRRCSCWARVNALTLNGLTSEIALRFTPQGAPASGAARGRSTTSTSIPGR